MNEDILYSAILSLAFLLLFAVAELLYHFFHIKAEHTRKLVHVATGIITLLFPVLLSSHWYVLVLCGSFFFILIISLKFKFLPSINNIGRVSQGSVSYPVAVYGCFYIYSLFDNFIFFYLPVLVLALSDPLAAIIGKKLAWGKYVIVHDQKTLVGSGAFLLSAFVVSVTLLLQFTILSQQHILLLAGGIALGTCFAEAIAQKGYDNLTVPFVAIVILLVGRYYLLY